jgi:fatty-acid peroxygenase
MPRIARDPTFEASIGMLRDGYDFIWSRCRRSETDLFSTRLLGRRAVCIHGREAAKLFYDESKVQRTRAVPRRVLTSLFGKGAVHTLDGHAHQTRKSAFLSLMTPESLERLAEETARHWRVAVRRWEDAESIVLFEEVQKILTEATCAWAGVPLHSNELSRRANDFGAMVDAFGGIGPRLWRGKLARARAERWMTRFVRETRQGTRHPDPRSALAVMAHHRDHRGKRLAARTAAIEVLNVIRPTVAVAWYVAFAALALHEHPQWRGRLAANARGDQLDCFMQEIRRFYPFTPYLGAKVSAPFEWKGHRFKIGTLLLLDVYGTDRDSRLWESPDEFRPERFARREADAFDLIPQGGGTRLGHRCPGEWITMNNLSLALHFLTRCMTYEVRPQDLRIDLRRMPTRPRSGVVLHNVRATAALDESIPNPPSPTAADDNMASLRAGELGTIEAARARFARGGSAHAPK